LHFPVQKPTGKKMTEFFQNVEWTRKFVVDEVLSYQLSSQLSSGLLCGLDGTELF